MRVAFTLFRDQSWTGGVNYLRNLFAALAELPGRPIEPVLFAAPGASANSLSALRPYLLRDPVIVDGWGADRSSRIQRLVGSVVLQSDAVSLKAFQAAQIDLVFLNEGWYGLRFPIPVLAWIADFQHCHLRSMFSRFGLLKRDLKYSAYCRVASSMMVSSEDARHDCENFFPSAKGRVAVVPFAVDLPDLASAPSPQDILKEHRLPDKYIYFPGQLWRHKNHLGVVNALRVLRQNGENVVIVSTGNPHDGRHPDHPRQVMDAVKEAALDDSFRFLGLVPYPHIQALMRASIAVINPSLFEGWSTTVEEAKAIGSPLLLSDLRVHREQTMGKAMYFDPQSAGSMADIIRQAWASFPSGSDIAREAVASVHYAQARRVFGQRFAELAFATLGTPAAFHVGLG